MITTQLFCVFAYGFIHIYSSCVSAGEAFVVAAATTPGMSGM